MAARRRVGSEEGDGLETTAFYAPPEAFSDGRVEFPESELHHLRDVLRCREGDRVEVLDGCGGRYRVRVEMVGGTLCGRVVEAECLDRLRPLISAAVAVGRKERMRFAVEKLAELGCHRIIPLLTEHVSFPGDPAKLATRLEPVCLSALKQSRQPFLTRIEAPVSFDCFLEICSPDSLEPVFCHRNTECGALSSRNSLGGACEYCLAVGPEGGFSRRESEAIRSSGAVCMSLGPCDLRFETAAVAGFVVLRQALWGDPGLFGPTALTLT